MNQQTVSVKPGTFRSVLVPIAAALFATAALCGALALGSLLRSASIPAILHDMELAQIYDYTAQKTWLVIYIAVTAVNFLGTLVLSAGMFQVIAGRHYTGMDLMFNYAKWMLRLVNISGVAALAYFIFRAVRYIVVLMSYGIVNALVPLYSMVLMEGFLGVQAWFLFVQIRRFLNCAMDATAGIGRTLSSGTLTAPTIPALSVFGFLVFAGVDAAIALDRFFTFTHKKINHYDVFEIPFTTEPAQFFSGLSFTFAAVGSVLLYFYLRSYKNKSERLLIRSIEVTPLH